MAISVLPSSVVATLERAMLPLDGMIAEHVPHMLNAYARIVPKREWPALTVVDFTAGSCFMPLLFAAAGVRRVIVNDTAERSCVAARALFGRTRIDPRVVKKLLTARRPRLRRHTPSFHFAADYLTEAVADVFDRLYFAPMPKAVRAPYEYLALRWVAGFAPASDETGGINILPSHDERQLLDDLEHDWRPYVRRARNRDRVLAGLVTDVNAGIACRKTQRVEIHQADMLDLCRRIDYGRRALVMINPPTNGLDEYVIDDQFAHSLLANRWLPLSRSRESAKDFWTQRVRAALRALPRGAHALVWGGDGALAWDECLAVWKEFAEPVFVHRFRQGARRPGWAIVARA